MPRAAARHILVKRETECQGLIDQIKGGADFGAVAAEHSTCPSGQSGGSLGEFGRGQMVPEFDKAVFEDCRHHSRGRPMKRIHNRGRGVLLLDVLFVKTRQWAV